MIGLVAGVGIIALAWIVFHFRQSRAIRDLATRPRQEVLDNPAEPRASTRFRAVVRTEERPKWAAWGEAVAASDVAATAASPRWSPTESVFNPECTVVIEETATGRVLRSYPWGRDLPGAERHAQSLNERAAAEGVTKFYADVL